MSDQEVKITASPKVKNPKRVEQGKRLAAISKAAKERKRKEKEEANEAQQCHEASDWVTTTTLTVPVIGAVIAIGGYLYWYRSKEEPVETSEQPPQERPMRSPSKIPVRKLEKL